MDVNFAESHDVLVDVVAAGAAVGGGVLGKGGAPYRGSLAWVVPLSTQLGGRQWGHEVCKIVTLFVHTSPMGDPSVQTDRHGLFVLFVQWT